MAEQTMIRIHNIPYNLSREQVEEIIKTKLGSTYGPIHTVSSIPSGARKNKGFAFVYGTEELLRAKEELVGWTINGKPVQLRLEDEPGHRIPTGGQPDQDVKEIMQQSIDLLLQAKKNKLVKSEVGDLLAKQKIRIQGGVRKVNTWVKRHYQNGMIEYLDHLADRSRGKITVDDDCTVHLLP